MLSIVFVMLGYERDSAFASTAGGPRAIDGIAALSGGHVGGRSR